MLNISCGGLENELYNVLVEEIRKYINGEISEFPVLSKFYD